MTTPKEAERELRQVIESQGPDTSNRHYGRNQYAHLIKLLDIIKAQLDVEEVDVEDAGVDELLQAVAEEPIEEWDDTDELSARWLTADDIASRTRARLRELKYWWEA